MADTKWSQFPSATPGNSDEVVGLHSGDNARFSIANIVAAVRNGLASIFVPLTRTVNGKALSTDISLDSSDIDYDNTQSGLTATDVQEAIDELAQGGGGGGSAADITYDPTTSGLTATDVQDAIDEVVGDLDGKQDTVTASGILKGDGAGGVSAAVAGTDYGTYSKPSGGIPASDLANGVIPSVPSAYTYNPAMDGTASPGSSNDYARGDHVHPTDTSRASASDVASLDERYTNNVTWRMNTDANNYKTSGLYAMATGNANVPAPWGILFVQGAILDTIEQEYRSEGYIWNREFRNNTWSSWKDTTPTSELIGVGHTLIRYGKLRILKVEGFYAGQAVITIPVADRPTSTTSGIATFNDSNSASMTVGFVTINTDGSIVYQSWSGYNSYSISNITSRWVTCPCVMWMTA